MSIDPAKLERQRLSLVPRDEYPCPRCGRRTTNREGVCAACAKAKIPPLASLRSDHVAGIMEACRKELERRRAELDGMLGGSK